MENFITSLTNPKIKNAIKLRKPRESKKQDLILVEGEKEISLALKGGFEIKELFYCASFKRRANSELGIYNKNIIRVSKKVFEKISYRDNPDGFLALVKRQETQLFEVKLSKAPLVIVLEGIEKPGNLGAILRTADAAGVDAVILNDSHIDIYNPNAIRSSIGTIFMKQVVEASRVNTIKWLKKNKIRSFATSKAGKSDYSKANYKKATAFIMGSEHDGLSEAWKKAADDFIKIPMKGSASSLNLSVSTAILVYEAISQRGKR
ncbi:RNA methyltransferase [Candidatus Falkowbacteria bacterium]|nr:RNA methyltransferase [Candidatus Falkowbacteria bacterium]